jgi:O-antigen/teichoic acid export membrane protein
MTAVFPAVSRMAAESHESLRRDQISVTRVILLLLFPLVGALLALSPIIINLLYGNAYADASMVFSLSLLAVIPGAVHLILIMPLVANHAVGRLSIIYSAAITAEVVVNLLLYSRIGLLAAVAGAVLASLITAVLADKYAFPGASMLRDHRIIKTLVAGAISLAIPFTGIFESQRWLLCGVTVSAFLLVMGILKSFPFQELRRTDTLA